MLDTADKNIPLVVAGDISNDVDNNCGWLVQLKQRFDKVVWTPGNHDFYNMGFHQTRLMPTAEYAAKWPTPKTVPEIVDHYRRWSEEHGIYFLHRSSVELDGVEFVGSTGWHDFEAGNPIPFDQQVLTWKRNMPESHLIPWDLTGHAITWQRVLKEAQLEQAAIHALVVNNSLPKVVVTHHVPNRQFLQYRTDRIWNALNGAFCNTLLEQVKDPSIRVWCFGHTHYTWDRDFDGVRFVCNPKGYHGENPSWQPREIEVN